MLYYFKVQLSILHSDFSYLPSVLKLLVIIVDDTWGSNVALICLRWYQKIIAFSLKISIF